MSGSPHEVFLKDSHTRVLVPAQLYDNIQRRHLDDQARLWMPHYEADEEHEHWNWREKWDDYSDQLSFQFFALECEGETQGMMIVNTIKRCRLPEQFNQHLVYVEYLEAAPWNRRNIPSRNRY